MKPKKDVRAKGKVYVMAKIGRAKTETKLKNYFFDGLAMGISGVLTGTLGPLGAVGSLWLAPKVAKTQAGKQFNKYLALLLLVDSLMEQFVGTRGVV